MSHALRKFPVVALLSVLALVVPTAAADAAPTNTVAVSYKTAKKCWTPLLCSETLTSITFTAKTDTVMKTLRNTSKVVQGWGGSLVMQHQSEISNSTDVSYTWAAGAINGYWKASVEAYFSKSDYSFHTTKSKDIIVPLTRR